MQAALIALATNLHHLGDPVVIFISLQDATADLEKKIKRICEICKERQEVAERERALTQRKYQKKYFYIT